MTKSAGAQHLPVPEGHTLIATTPGGGIITTSRPQNYKAALKKLEKVEGELKDAQRRLEDTEFDLKRLETRLQESETSHEEDCTTLMGVYLTMMCENFNRFRTTRVITLEKDPYSPFLNNYNAVEDEMTKTVISLAKKHSFLCTKTFGEQKLSLVGYAILLRNREMLDKLLYTQLIDLSNAGEYITSDVMVRVLEAEEAISEPILRRSVSYIKGILEDYRKYHAGSKEGPAYSDELKYHRAAYQHSPPSSDDDDYSD